MATLDKALRFRTERFDYTSDLPADANAGNRFYGRDAAAFLCERLQARGLEADFLDEDWGWLVHGRADASTRFEIAVYNLDAHGEGGRAGAPEWGLWIRAFERTNRLLVLTRRIEVEVPAAVETTVREAIAELGASVQDWTDGPGR